jgi:hypothetical protein
MKARVILTVEEFKAVADLKVMRLVRVARMILQEANLDDLSTQDQIALLAVAATVMGGIDNAF